MAKICKIVDLESNFQFQQLREESKMIARAISHLFSSREECEAVDVAGVLWSRCGDVHSEIFSARLSMFVLMLGADQVSRDEIRLELENIDARVRQMYLLKLLGHPLIIH